MAEVHPTYITGTVTLSDGTESQFSITPDIGWQQWGGRDAGRTVDLMDALVEAACEAGLREADEEEDPDAV